MKALKVPRVFAVAVLTFVVSSTVFADTHVEPPALHTDSGGFEFIDPNAEATSPPDIVDTNTFPGWRFINSDSANASFTAAITDHASAGVQAMRLSVDNAGAGASYALDQWEGAMQTPVDSGTTYIVAFDAAWVAGVATDNLLFQVQEFDQAGVFVGDGLTRTWSVGSEQYATYEMVYRPVHPDAAGVGFAFSPMQGRTGATTLDIDDIRLQVAGTPVNGGFELGPIVEAGGEGTFVDTTSFLGWRLFSVGSPAITSLTGTLVDASAYEGGEEGGRAMRLEVTNTGTPSGHDYGLDNDNERIPVMFGETYTLSFDVAVIGVTDGPVNLTTSIAEFYAGGESNGASGSIITSLVNDSVFRSFSAVYEISDPDTTHLVIAFRPATTGQSVLLIDNVQLVRKLNTIPPTLTVEVTPDQLNLIWPQSHLGWLLQSNTSDVTDPAGWEDVPGTAEATERAFPIQPGSPDTFYRLRLP